MTAAQLQDLAASWQDKQLHLRHRPQQQQQQQQLDIQQLAAFPSQTLNKAIFCFPSCNFCFTSCAFLGDISSFWPLYRHQSKMSSSKKIYLVMDFAAGV
jgi:hypothetical protein